MRVSAKAARVNTLLRLLLLLLFLFIGTTILVLLLRSTTKFAQILHQKNAHFLLGFRNPKYLRLKFSPAVSVFLFIAEEDDDREEENGRDHDDDGDEKTQQQKDRYTLSRFITSLFFRFSAL